LRTTTYVLRFIHNVKCRKERHKTGIITVEEIKQAKLKIINLVQAEEFKEEIAALRSKKKIPRSSRLTVLHLFLDNNGITRVGGRLKHAVLVEEVETSCITISLASFYQADNRISPREIVSCGSPNYSKLHKGRILANNGKKSSKKNVTAQNVTKHTLGPVGN